MLHTLLLILAALTLALWLAGAVEMGLGARVLHELRDLPPVEPTAAPRVSVVIAARNEEHGLEAGLRSILAQQYPALEVIVVDDRSTDATAAILHRMEVTSPRLRTVRVESLPPGWLGKNHALHHGARAAQGEWILFTDADVVMEPTAISRAIGYVEREGYDHLAVAPELTMPGPLLNAFGGAFGIYFARFTRPWKARDPRSSRHVGVGAFNLVRTAAYRAVGGHEPLAMRPDDDLKLGKLLKKSGYRQDVAFGRGMVSVEWYSSVGEVVRGLEKNSFAGLEYSVPAVVAAVLALLLFDVWPFVAPFVTDGLVFWLYLASAATAVLLFAASSRGSGSNPLFGLLYPVVTLLFAFIVVRATWLALRNGGIRWRDTVYPLDELRANRV